MVVLSNPVSQAVVQRFKGKLDFYLVGQQWRVRKWPVNIRTTFSAGETLAQCHLVHATHLYTQTSDMLRLEYGCATDSGWWNRRDFFMKNYFGTIDPFPALAWDHHPPQPTPCPRGDFHYFALLRTWAEAEIGFHFRVFFLFDGPGDYRFWTIRTRPTMRTLPHIVWPDQHLAWSTTRAGAGFLDVGTTPDGGNIYHRRFLALPGADTGPWWFFLSIRNPYGAHPGLSLTPMFKVDVPDLSAPHAPGLRNGAHTVVRDATMCRATFDQIETPPS